MTTIILWLMGILGTGFFGWTLALNYSRFRKWAVWPHGKGVMSTESRRCLLLQGACVMLLVGEPIVFGLPTYGLPLLALVLLFSGFWLSASFHRN